MQAAGEPHGVNGEMLGVVLLKTSQKYPRMYILLGTSGADFDFSQIIWQKTVFVSLVFTGWKKLLLKENHF